MRCPACDAPLIPGIEHCVACGDPVLPLEAYITVRGVELGDVTPEPGPAWARAFTQTMTEGRALERADDTAHAIILYERLVSIGCYFPQPFRRLAILYRRAKNAADEERVVRQALGRLSDHVNSWFIVRLARILNEGVTRGSA